MREIAFTLTLFAFSYALAPAQLATTYSVGTTNWSDVSFADTLVGWVCGDTMLMRTTDGGQAWSITNSLSGAFSGVAASCKNAAFVSWSAGSYSHFGRTTNSGMSWDTLASSCTSCISDIYYSHIKSRDSLHVWVAERAGSPLADYINVFRTTDGGNSWTPLLTSHGSPFNFADLSVAPDSAVATLFARKTYFRSIDDGAHWIADTLAKPCNAVSIAGRYQFWAAGDSGVVYRSQAYGAPFYEQNTGFTQNVAALAAIDTQTIWAVGTGGLIARTTNGGTSWEVIPSRTAATLNSVCFIDANHGWIVGDSGTILQIRGGLVSSASEPVTPPRELALFPNYPNPFNPSTNITFSLPARSFVSLEIYDLLGRKIKTLVNQELSAGQNVRTWNAADAPSGIYFCRFKVGSFVQTKKLVLIR